MFDRHQPVREYESRLAEELEDRIALAVDTVLVTSPTSVTNMDGALPSQVIANEDVSGVYQQFIREGLNVSTLPNSGNVFVVNPTSFFQFDAQGNLMATGPSSEVTFQTQNLSELEQPFIILVDTGISGFAFPSGSFNLAQLGTPLYDPNGNSFLLISDGSTSSNDIQSFDNFLRSFNQIEFDQRDSNVQVTSLSSREFDSLAPTTPQITQDVSSISTSEGSLVLTELTGRPYLRRINPRPQAAASTNQHTYIAGGVDSGAPRLSLNQLATALNESVDSALRSADRIITGRPTFPTRVGYLRDALPLPLNAGISVLRALSISDGSQNSEPSSEGRRSVPSAEVNPSTIDNDNKPVSDSEASVLGAIAALSMFSGWPLLTKGRRPSSGRDKSGCE